MKYLPYFEAWIWWAKIRWLFTGIAISIHAPGAGPTVIAALGIGINFAFHSGITWTSRAWVNCTIDSISGHLAWAPLTFERVVPSLVAFHSRITGTGHTGIRLQDFGARCPITNVTFRTWATNKCVSIILTLDTWNVNDEINTHFFDEKIVLVIPSKQGLSLQARGICFGSAVHWIPSPSISSGQTPHSNDIPSLATWQRTPS